MNARSTKVVRCAIYTRVSTDQGLEQDFNSLDAQYDTSQAYIFETMPSLRTNRTAGHPPLSLEAHWQCHRASAILTGGVRGVR